MNVKNGVFANLVDVNAFDEGFVLDFCLKAVGETHVVSRVILTKAHARRIAKELLKRTGEELK